MKNYIMCKIIKIGGLDGSGKSSQIKLIKEYYENKGLKCKFIHFPMYGHNKYSDMISSFLRGEYGENDDVNPWFVANIYAMDRSSYLKELKVDLHQYDVLIMDRYVYSNIAFQCAKIKNNKEKELLKKWILDFEFNFISLPKPNLILFLDVPINEIEKRLNDDRKGDDRNYLNGKKDIHESDIKFQEKVRDEYIKMNNEIDNFNIINTFDKDNKLYNIKELFNTYKHLL